MCPPVGPPKVGRYRFYREKAVEHMQVTPMRCTGKCRAYHASKDSSGCSSTQAEAHAKESRRRRECVHGVGNVSEDKSSVRQRIRTKTDRTVTSSLPCWAASTQVDRARGARGPLTLRGADDEGRGLKGSNKQRGPVLFYVCNRLKENSGWVPEREHTAQNGKWKLLDVR